MRFFIRQRKLRTELIDCLDSRGECPFAVKRTNKAKTFSTFVPFIVYEWNRPENNAENYLCFNSWNRWEQLPSEIKSFAISIVNRMIKTEMYGLPRLWIHFHTWLSHSTLLCIERIEVGCDCEFINFRFKTLAVCPWNNYVYKLPFYWAK